MNLRQKINRHIDRYYTRFPEEDGRLDVFKKDSSKFIFAHDDEQEGLCVFEFKQHKRVIREPSNIRLLGTDRYDPGEEEIKNYFKIVLLSYLEIPRQNNIRSLVRGCYQKARIRFGSYPVIGNLTRKCPCLKLANNPAQRNRIIDAFSNLGVFSVRQENENNDTVITTRGRQLRLGRLFARSFPISHPEQIDEE